MRKFKTITPLTIAALLILSAAICTLAQSGAAKQNSRDQATSPNISAEKPATEPLKQNGREKLAPPAAMAKTVPGDPVRYSYEFEQPDFVVRYIRIEHGADGRGEISFTRRGEDNPFVEPLVLSPSALARITALWEALRFIDSETNYQADKQFPHLGTMRLRMVREQRQRVAEFNWTRDQNVFALVNEYKRAADQAIFVFNITVARENQPLEAPKLLDHLDALLKRGGLSDPQQLVSLLRDLNTDERIPLIARNHAARLLKQIEKSAPRG